MNAGFVKLHRQLLDWEWYDDKNCRLVFIHCLLKANFKDKRWKGQEIKRGSFVTSLGKLSGEIGISKQQLRTVLAKLSKTGEITHSSSNSNTLITLCKYNEYQGVASENENKITHEQHTSNTRATHEQHTDNKRITTTKEGKKERREEVPPVQVPFDLEKARTSIEAKFGTGVELLKNLQSEQKKQTGIELTEQQISFAYVSFLQKGMVETYRGRIKEEYQLFAKLFHWIGQQHRFENINQTIKEVPEHENLEEYLIENYTAKTLTLYRKNGKLEEWASKFKEHRFKLTNIAKAYENPKITAMLLFEVAFLPIGKKLSGSTADRKIESFKRYVGGLSDFLIKKGDIRELLLNRKNK